MAGSKKMAKSSSGRSDRSQPVVDKGPRSPSAPVQTQAPSSAISFKQRVEEFDRSRRSKMLSRGAAKNKKERRALPPWDLNVSIRSYEGVGPWFGSPTSKQQEMDIPLSISNMHLEQVGDPKQASMHIQSSIVELSRPGQEQRIAVDKPQAKERIVRKASWKKGALLAPKKPRRSLAALGLVAGPTPKIAANRRPNDTKRLLDMARARKTAPAAFKLFKGVSTTDVGDKIAPKQNHGPPLRKPELPESGNQLQSRVPSPQENEKDNCLPLIKTLAQQLLNRVDAACTSNPSDEGETKPFADRMMPPDSITSSQTLPNSQARQDLLADNIMVTTDRFPRKTDLSELEQAGTMLATTPSAGSEHQPSSLLQPRPDMKEESNQTCRDEPSSSRFSQTYSDIFVIRLPCVREEANQFCLSYLGKVEGAALTAGLQIHQVTEEAEECDPALGKASKLSQTNPDIYQIKLPNLQRVLRERNEDASGRPGMKEWTSGSKRDPLSVINIYARQRQTEARVKGEEPSANSVERALVFMPSPVPPEDPERPFSYKLSHNNVKEEFQSFGDGSTETAVRTNSSQLAYHRTRSQKRRTSRPWNKLSLEIKKLKRIRKEWKHDIVSAHLHGDVYPVSESDVVLSSPALLADMAQFRDDVVAVHHSRQHLSLRQEAQKMDWLERNVAEKRKQADELRLKWKRHLLELELQRLDAEIHETRTRIERAVNEQSDSQVKQEQAQQKSENESDHQAGSPYTFGLHGETQISHAHLHLDEVRQEPGKEGCESVIGSTNYSDSFMSESALQQPKEVRTPAGVVQHTFKHRNSSWREERETDSLALVEDLECEPASNASEHDTAATVSEETTFASTFTNPGDHEIVDDFSSLASEAIRPAPSEQNSKLENLKIDQESDEALVNEGRRTILFLTTPDQVRGVFGALDDHEQEPFGQSTILDPTSKLDESSTSTGAVQEELRDAPTFLEESVVSQATFHPSTCSPLSQPNIPPPEESGRRPCQGQEVKATESTFDGDREAASPSPTGSFSSDFSDFDEEEDEKAAERGQPAFDVSVPEAAQETSGTGIRLSRPSEEQAPSTEQPAGNSLELDEDIPEEISIEASLAEENDGPEADLTSEGYESDLNFMEGALSNETGTPLTKPHENALEMGKAMLVEARLQREIGKLEQHNVLADRRMTDMLFGTISQDEFPGTNNHRALGTSKAVDSYHPVRKTSPMVLKTSSGVSSKSYLWSQDFVIKYVDQLLKLQNSGTAEDWDRVAEEMSTYASVKHQTMFFDCVKEVIQKQKGLSKEVSVKMVISSIMGYLATSQLPVQEIVKTSCLAHCEDAQIVNEPDNHGQAMRGLVTDMCDSLFADMLSDIVQDL